MSSFFSVIASQLFFQSTYLTNRNYVSSLFVHLLSLPADSGFPSGYVSRFNDKIKVLISNPNYYYDMLSF